MGRRKSYIDDPGIENDACDLPQGLLENDSRFEADNIWGRRKKQE